MVKYYFDETSFQCTAQALLVINPVPLARIGLETEAQLIDYMKGGTEHQLAEPGFWGTGGFYVSITPHLGGEPGDLHCMASVMAYSVVRYLQERAEVEAVAPLPTDSDTIAKIDDLRENAAILERYANGRSSSAHTSQALKNAEAYRASADVLEEPILRSKITRLRKEADLEQGASYSQKEWPHHRAQAAESARRKYDEANRLEERLDNNKKQG